MKHLAYKYTVGSCSCTCVSIVFQYNLISFVTAKQGGTCSFFTFLFFFWQSLMIGLRELDTEQRKWTTITADWLENLVRCIAACMHTLRKQLKREKKNVVVNLCKCCSAGPCTAGSCDIAPCAPPESCAACNSVHNKHICGVCQLFRKTTRITSQLLT